MTERETETQAAQHEAAYQEIKRQMARVPNPPDTQLRYFFAVISTQMQRSMPGITSAETEALWQQWVTEQSENPSHAQAS